MPNATVASMDHPTSAERVLPITSGSTVPLTLALRFHDINDDQVLCELDACEYDDVVLTAGSSGWVVSDDSWRYVAKGVLTSMLPTLGQHNTDITKPVSGSVRTKATLSGSSLLMDGQ